MTVRRLALRSRGPSSEHAPPTPAHPEFPSVLVTYLATYLPIDDFVLRRSFLLAVLLPPSPSSRPGCLGCVPALGHHHTTTTLPRLPCSTVVAVSFRPVCGGSNIWTTYQNLDHYHPLYSRPVTAPSPLRHHASYTRQPARPSFPWAELKHVTGRIGRYFKYHTISRAQRLLGKLPIISWPFNRARVLAHALARARNRRNRRARREAREAANNNDGNINNYRETSPSPPRTPYPAHHSGNGGAAQRSSPSGSPSAQLLFEQAQRPPAAAATPPPPPPPPPPQAPRRKIRLLAEVDEDNIVHGGRVRRQTKRYQ
ncbi:hypothetical protein DIS24_g10191 [Lasiodiplodia hormozganensis]|uniref:Uncharacterized protein n=1 Tax=Lasiodiplodia hormozganensis TaxID=869390 RepID=A0AA39XS17_9PEZI|nr:hypothetical protein DIS24_g10191 [Lasiodiplodia hormozganensis]